MPGIKQWQETWTHALGKGPRDDNPVYRNTFVQWLCSDLVRMQVWAWICKQGLSANLETGLKRAHARGLDKGPTIRSQARQLYGRCVHRSRAAPFSGPLPQRESDCWRVEVGHVSLLPASGPGKLRPIIFSGPPATSDSCFDLQQSLWTGRAHGYGQALRGHRPPPLLSPPRSLRARSKANSYGPEKRSFAAGRKLGSNDGPGDRLCLPSLWRDA